MAVIKGKLKRELDQRNDTVLQYKNWRFIITELIGGDTDYVYRIYVNARSLFVYDGYIEFQKDYKTLMGAKRAVVNFIIKELA